MRLLTTVFADPAWNLAFEEAVLEAVERGASPDTLRVWESPANFVVMGVAQIASREIFLERCAEDGMPVLRRCTAGGCVLQGPGCLNYSLTASIARDEQLATIHGAYRYALDRIAAALARRGIVAQLAGICDLASDACKFSGNAQRRKKHAVLVHGTLLYAVDAARMRRYLREPEDRPEYRGTRGHADFVRALEVSPGGLAGAVLEAFGITGDASAPDGAEIAETQRLVREKYAMESWTFRR